MQRKRECTDPDSAEFIAAASRLSADTSAHLISAMPPKGRPWRPLTVKFYSRLVLAAILASFLLAAWQMQRIAGGQDWRWAAALVALPLLLAGALVLHQRRRWLADETALRQSELLRRRACVMARLCHWRVDLIQDPTGSLGVDDYSGEVIEIFGVPPAQLKLGGGDYYRNLVHPDDAKQAQAAYARFLADTAQRTHGTEYRIRHADGRYRVIREMAEKVADESGRAIEVIGTIQDITDLHEAVNQLNVAEGQLGIAHRLANMGFWYWQPPPPGLDHDLGYYYSPELRKILRHNVSTQAYSDAGYVEEVVHPDDRARVLAVLQDYRDGRIDIYSMEYRALPSTGGVVHLRSVGERRRNMDGVAIFATGIVQDITALRETALTLEMTLQQLNFAHRLAKLGCWRWQPPDDTGSAGNLSEKEGQNYSYALAHLDLLGVDEETLRDCTNEEYCRRYVHPEDRQRMFDLYRRWERDELDDFAVDYRFLRPDGRQIVLHAVAHRSRDAFNKPVFAVGLFQDVTEAKERETLLMQALARAEAANHAKTQFLAHMSHELRTPLNAAIGFADTMALGLLGPVPAAYGGYAEAIASSGRHLLQAIDEILLASHLELGDRKLDEQILRLDEVVATTVDALAADARSNGIEIDIDDIPRPLSICGDLPALQLTLRHVLANTIKSMPAGGRIRLWIDTREEAGGLHWLDISIGEMAGTDSAGDRRLRREASASGDAYLASQRGGFQFSIDIARRFMELHDGQLIFVDRPQLPAASGEAMRSMTILRLPGDRLRMAADAAQLATAYRTRLPVRRSDLAGRG